ncbi:MAG: Hsp70 family protein [Deltaproteobacteria bacterium]|nr:Hsp70 family protein [Deltaproteobacteria bacterium]
MASVEEIRQALTGLKDFSIPLPPGARSTLVGLIRELPKTGENLDLFRLCFELIGRIEDPTDKKAATLEFVKEIPSTDAFAQFYALVTDAAIDAADSLDEAARRITELLRIAKETHPAKAFVKLRARAWRLAMGLPDSPRYKAPDMVKTAKELPKPNDYVFFRRYTLMGILNDMSKDPEFDATHRDGIDLAMKATELIVEPYYRKYALMYLADILKEREDVFDLYKRTLTEAHAAALTIKDPFAKQFALIDILQQIPKTQGFMELLEDVISESLAFFTLKKWVGDLDAVDMVDYILSAEEPGISDSKKRRFDREKYANILAGEIEEFGNTLSDIRFIPALKPYTHVWVQPATLRDAVKGVVERLESRKDIFHGREIQRPSFVSELYPDGPGRYIHKKDAPASECVAIDLGATNTVIMRKRGAAQPDFVHLPSISREYDGAVTVPTILSAETNRIGAEVFAEREESPIANIKQMMLEGNPKGRVYMERFFKLLFSQMKKAAPSAGWFNILSKGTTDVFYITVPVGYQFYRNAMKEIAGKTIRGARVEFIEEPLAAAIGYQVVENRDKIVMVIDFGGSTLNIMAVRVNVNEVHVAAKPDRAQMIGGRDIDVWLAEYLAKKAGIAAVTYGVVCAAEEVKIALSKLEDAPFVWQGRESLRVSRNEFEAVLDGHNFYKLIDRSVTYVLKKAEKVGLKKDAIEAVLLTGGSSQIPSFKEKIGAIFPELRAGNLIFDHSPFTAVGYGAALYGTRDVTDRHLGLAYALRHATNDMDSPHSFCIVLEKGEPLPMEKTFKLTPACKLGEQKDIYLELFEVPDTYITRLWVKEGGMEFLKQEFKGREGKGGERPALAGFKPITLAFNEPLKEDVFVTLVVNDKGFLSIKFGGAIIEPGIRLQ